MTDRLHQMTLLRALPLIEMPERELRILGFMLIHGRNRGWTALAGSTVVNSLWLQTGLSIQPVRRAVAGLEERGWVKSGLDLQDRQRLTITAAFDAVAQTALDHKAVRSALGVRGWTSLDGDDGLAAFIIAEARKLEAKRVEGAYTGEVPSRERDRIKVVAKDLYWSRKRVQTKAKKVSPKDRRAVIRLVPRTPEAAPEC